MCGGKRKKRKEKAMRRMFRNNKTVELPTGAKVRHRFDNYKNAYIITVATPRKR